MNVCVPVYALKKCLILAQLLCRTITYSLLHCLPFVNAFDGVSLQLHIYTHTCTHAAKQTSISANNTTAASIKRK